MAVDCVFDNHIAATGMPIYHGLPSPVVGVQPTGTVWQGCLQACVAVKLLPSSWQAVVILVPIHMFDRFRLYCAIYHCLKQALIQPKHARLKLQSKHTSSRAAQAGRLPAGRLPLPGKTACFGKFNRHWDSSSSSSSSFHPAAHSCALKIWKPQQQQLQQQEQRLKQQTTQQRHTVGLQTVCWQSTTALSHLRQQQQQQEETYISTGTLRIWPRAYFL
jgi:hypothetical protein